MSPSLTILALFRALYIFIASATQANRNRVKIRAHEPLTARSASSPCVFWQLSEAVLLLTNVKKELLASQSLAIISLLVNRTTDVRHCVVLFYSVGGSVLRH